MYRLATSLLVVSLVLAFLSGVGADLNDAVGNGLFLYRLDVVQDVCLERSSTNFNYLEFLIVGEHPGYPNKRSLLQFEDLPSDIGCKVEKAYMYVYYAYSHKASFNSVDEVPLLRRKMDVHMVLSPWDEAQATSSRSMSGVDWDQQYLGIDGTDARALVEGTWTYNIGAPSGFKEYEVTKAVKKWASGQKDNNGILLKVRNEEEQGRDVRFYSNAHSDSSKHAYIQVLCSET